MTTISFKSPKGPSDRADSPPLNYGTFKKSLEHLSGFFSSPLAQDAKGFFDELDKLKNQLKTMRKTLDDQTEEHIIAVRHVSSKLQQETKRASDAEEKMKSTRNTLEDKNKVISEHAQIRKDLESQIQCLKSAKSQTEGNMALANQEISSLQEKLKQKDSVIGKCRTIESDLNRGLSFEKQRNKQSQEMLVAEQDKVRDMQCRLDKLEGFCARRQETDEQTMMDNFDHLWKYAATEMSTILSHNLEPKTLKDLNLWKNLGEECRRLAPYFPLPVSNSNAAKGMRLAVILAILSREIDKYIFQPAYLMTDDSNLRKTLSQLAGTEPEKEAFYRSLTLSIDSRAQKAILRTNAQTVVQSLSNCVFGIFSDSRHSEFREITKRIVRKAVEVWEPIQHAHRKYEPGFDLQDEHWPFIFPGEENGNDPKEIISELKKDVLMIFPGISSVEHGLRQQQNHVISLSKLHPLYVLADREASSAPPSPVTDRIPSTKSRRLSISSNVQRINGRSLSDKKANGAH